MKAKEYLDIFIEESREHLQLLNKNLLELEQDSNNKQALDEIFRAAHTLKGMSATMGFEKIAELTHKMESFLEDVRNGKKKFCVNSADLLFKCMDILEEMIENKALGIEEEINITDLLEKLDNDFKAEEQKEEKIYQVENMEQFGVDIIDSSELIEENLQRYQLTVEFSEDCQMKTVRAFMVQKALEQLGKITQIIPEIQDCNDEVIEKDLNIILVSDRNSEEIKEIVNQISEVILSDITEIRNYEEQNSLRKEINSKINQSVRVDIHKLDCLMNLVGELVINKNCLEQISKTNNFSSLNETKEQIDRITTELQNVVMSVRMIPIERVFNRFPRMVRDLAKSLNKEVKLVMQGKETELDRIVIDEIGDPLVHLIRNSIDHGIEGIEERKKKGKDTQGTLQLSAKQKGNSVYIIVEDDGRGIDLEKVKKKALEREIITAEEAEQMDQKSIIDLIFSPDFSTAEKVSDISGRGVGLDVVKEKINILNGAVSVESEADKYTKFIIKLPLTLAIIQAMLIKVGNETYAIPLGNIDEITKLESEKVKYVQGQKVMIMRATVLPLVKLAEVLEVPDICAEKAKEIFVVVVNNGGQQLGLIVDELIGQHEIVISPLGKLLQGTLGIAGAAILGDGTVSLILDMATLL